MPTLNWIGKEAVVNHHLQVLFRLLKDVPDLACGQPAGGNLIVQGDNLVALKALLPYYASKRCQEPICPLTWAGTGRLTKRFLPPFLFLSGWNAGSDLRNALIGRNNAERWARGRRLSVAFRA